MQNRTQISEPKWNFCKTVGYKSRPSLCRQEEKNSVRLFRVEPVNILVTSNTIKLAPFDWALNLVWFQICVRDSYLLRGIQNVNFNVWVVPSCDRDRNAVKYTQKSAHDCWASSDQDHYNQLFFRITYICIDVAANCIDNIGTGFYLYT